MEKNMTPRLEKLEATKLVGNRITMSFANNKTGQLWQGFMPKRKEIPNATGKELYSVELYKDLDFFKTFDPTKEFEKWAAVNVTDFDSVPATMETLIIPAGEYAVFHYKGKPSQAAGTYQYILNVWLPGSGFVLDQRPHFALMGEKYKGEDPESEEEFWIPIKKR